MCASISSCASSSSRRRAITKASREIEARSRVHISGLLRAPESGDQSREPVPALHFTRQLPPARRGNRIELGAAVVLRCAPARRNPSPVLEPRQGGVDGALVQPEDVFADLL